MDEPRRDLIELINFVSKNVKPKVTILKNSKRMGIGYAIRRGLKYAMKMGYDVAVVMAGNGKDDPREIPRLLVKILAGCDYVQGSRYLPGGRYEKMPFVRRVFNRLWPLFWTLITYKRQTEVTNGFRAYKLSILKDPRINIDQPWLNHYALEYYIHYKVLTLGYKYCETAVSKIYPWGSRGGYSKIRPWRDWVHIVLPPILLKLRLKK